MFFAPGPSAWGAASKGKVTSPTTAGGKVFYGGDLESGTEALYPGITTSEQGLRWGFIQKARRLQATEGTLRCRRNGAARARVRAAPALLHATRVRLERVCARAAPPPPRALTC